MDSVTGSEISTTGQAVKKLGMSNLVSAGLAPDKGARVGLSDITNKQMVRLSNNPLPDSQEMAMLCKMLEERNKVIEIKSFELRTLRVSTQKLYTQNWQLAKTNAILLKELNLAKDKLKNQEHEHGCLLAVHKAKVSELEARGTIAKDDAPAKMDEGPSHSAALNNCKRLSVLTRRCQSKSLSSVGVNTAVKEMPGSKQTKNRRTRKSRILVSDQVELSEVDELEDEVTIPPLKSSEEMHETDDTSVLGSSTSIATEHKEGGIDSHVNCSASKHPTVPSTKSSGNTVPSKEKPVQTRKRMQTRKSRILVSDQVELSEVYELEDEVTTPPLKSSEEMQEDDTSVLASTTSIATEHKEGGGIDSHVYGSASKHPTVPSTKSSGNTHSKEKPVQSRKTMHASKHPTVPSTKSSGNTPSKEKPVQTRKRMQATHSSLPDLKKPKKEEVEEAKRCFPSEETAPYQKEEEKKAEVGRRRSYRAATQKVVSYKEKRITMKERRMI